MNSRVMLNKFLFLLVFAATVQGQPNILYINADDLGVMDVG